MQSHLPRTKWPPFCRHIVTSCSGDFISITIFITDDDLSSIRPIVTICRGYFISIKIALFNRCHSLLATLRYELNYQHKTLFLSTSFITSSVLCPIYVHWPVPEKKKTFILKMFYDKQPVPQVLWNRNVAILTKFPLMAPPLFVTANDENFVKMTTFPFQCSKIHWCDFGGSVMATLDQVLAWCHRQQTITWSKIVPGT